MAEESLMEKEKLSGREYELNRHAMTCRTVKLTTM